MKKLTILALFVALLIPNISSAQFAVGWHANSTGAGFIQPNRVNGVEQAVYTRSVHATSTADNNTFAGKVGIGTTTPTDALDISGSSPCLRLYDTDNPFDSKICNLFGQIGWTVGGNNQITGDGANVNLESFNGGDVALVSNSGLGNAILKANGDFIVGANGSGVPLIWKSATQRFGLGTSSPSYPFSLEGAIYQHGSYSHFGTAESPTPCNTFGAQCMEFIGDDNTTGGVGVQIQNINGGTSAYTYLNLLNNRFATNLSNFAGFFLNSGGYSDPTFGTANNVPDILMTENTMGNLGFIASSTAVGTNGQIQFYNQGANAATNLSMLIDRTGNVGIATATPDSTLDVKGSVRLEGISSVVTKSISGTITGLGCDSADTTVSGTMASTTAFITTPQTYPGDGLNWFSYALNSTTIRTKVCSDVTVTPAASLYTVKIIK